VRKKKPFADPKEIPPDELVATLCLGAEKLETGVSIVRLGWTPTKGQREAAQRAGFRLLGPGEPLT